MENRVIVEIEECLTVSPLKNKFLHMGQHAERSRSTSRTEMKI